MSNQLKIPACAICEPGFSYESKYAKYEEWAAEYNQPPERYYFARTFFSFAYRGRESTFGTLASP